MTHGRVFFERGPQVRLDGLAMRAPVRSELDQDRPLYVICRSGFRSAQAAQALAGAGWDASNVADGMVGWQAAGLPMTAESGQPYVA